MRVLVCPDKFAGTLSAPQAAAAIVHGWLAAAPADAATHTGCPYADRCALRRERCLVEAPILRENGPGHWVRCHFPVSR